MRRRHAAVGVALLLLAGGVVPASLLTSGGAPREATIEQTVAETPSSPEPPPGSSATAPSAPPDPPLAPSGATIPTTPEAAPPVPPAAAETDATPEVTPEQPIAETSAPPDPPLTQSDATTPTTPEAPPKPSGAETPATSEAPPTVPPAAAETDATPGVAPEQPIAETSVPPEPPVLSYTRLDLTGQATTPGSYAFLDPTGHAVTTYEALRDGTATALLIHKHDAHGVSQAARFDAVEPGDLFEWRLADDCWVRYEVMEVKPDPAGTVPRKHVGIAWTAYAFTGCAGTVATDTAASITVDPPSFFAPTITTPVRYGPYQLIPFNWYGALEEATEVAPSSSGASDASGTSQAPDDSDAPAWASGDPAVAHQHPLWNEPTLPAGWTLNGFSAEDWYIEARYDDNEGYWAATTWIARPQWRPRGLRVGDVGLQGYAEEERTIDGHPAYVQWYAHGSTVYIFDETSGIEYFANLATSSGDPDGRDIEDALALARSLYPNEPGPDAGTRLRLSYTRLDPTGQATTPGSYAFLDPTGHVVTTYEALRDGTATALLIHKHDAHGVSQAARFDAAEPGDLVEWRQADDCWVRYEVTEVKPDPAGTVPRKHAGIAWTAYAFTGCAGTVATDTAASVSWDLPVNFLSPTISVPVRYGPYQLVPFNWTGAIEESTRITPPSSRASGSSEDPAVPEWPSEDPAEVRQHPLWNEPALPEGWGLSSIWAEEWYVEAHYHDSRGFVAAQVWIARQDWRPLHRETGYTSLEGFVEEVRTIDGHPAFLHYYLLGSAVWIFDETAAVEYFARISASSSDPDGRDIEDAIALARSLYR